MVVTIIASSVSADNNDVWLLLRIEGAENSRFLSGEHTRLASRNPWSNNYPINWTNEIAPADSRRTGANHRQCSRVIILDPGKLSARAVISGPRSGLR